MNQAFLVEDFFVFGVFSEVGSVHPLGSGNVNFGLTNRRLQMKKAQKTPYSFRVGGDTGSASVAAIKAPVLGGGSVPVTALQEEPKGNRPGLILDKPRFCKNAVQQNV